MFSMLRFIIPRPFKRYYHFVVGYIGACVYRHPSRRMMVVGVTGTSGKSTAVSFATQLLRACGKKVCSLSTVEFSFPGGTRLNDKKMTMLGRFQTQRMLRRGADEGCEIAIVETTSEGVVQFRHRFIDYDTAVLTNLYPEHIESHGGFENYKQAKISFFRHVAHRRQKILNGKQVPVTLIVGAENEHSMDFMKPFSVNVKWCFGRENVMWHYSCGINTVRVRPLNERAPYVAFEYAHKRADTGVLGEHNLNNIAAAMTIAKSLGIADNDIMKAVGALSLPPGRLEIIDEGQPFTVLVDYAFEPKAMEALYAVVKKLPHNRILHVFGSTGGGRDTSRRYALGNYIAQNAYALYVTDEDPYDEDPVAIMDEVLCGGREAGKQEGINMWKIQSRKEAIGRAIAHAREGDIVLITGKGSEQAMAVRGGRLIPWDDRVIARGWLGQREEQFRTPS